MRTTQHPKILLIILGLFLSSSSSADESLHDHALVYQAVHDFIGSQLTEYDIQEIDSRLRLQSCPEKLSVRFPFTSNSTVEVVCPGNNGWKIFLKIITPNSPNSSITSQLPPSAQKKLDRLEAQLLRRANELAQKEEALAKQEELRQKALEEKENQIDETTTAVVASKTLQRGIPIRPGDLELEAFPSNRVKPGHFSEPQDLFGMEPTQTISRGAMISNSMVRPPTLISKGDLVTVVYSKNGLNVSNEGVALESGGLGSKISVFLNESNKTVSGTIADKGVVNLP